MLCWELWQIFSANALIIGKTQIALIIRKNADTKKRDCDRCAIPLPIIICLISRVYSAANTNSPVMSLKNTLYVPAGTLILLSTPFFVQVP